jgi:hypothetical protein
MFHKVYIGNSMLRNFKVGKIPPEGGTPNAFTVKLTRDCNDKALGVPALAGILRAAKVAAFPKKSCGLLAPSDDWGGRLIKNNPLTKEQLCLRKKEPPLNLNGT